MFWLVAALHLVVFLAVQQQNKLKKKTKTKKERKSN